LLTVKKVFLNRLNVRREFFNRLTGRREFFYQMVWSWSCHRRHYQAQWADPPLPHHLGSVSDSSLLPTSPVVHEWHEGLEGFHHPCADACGEEIPYRGRRMNRSRTREFFKQNVWSWYCFQLHYRVQCVGLGNTKNSLLSNLQETMSTPYWWL
jgi:hypothetical protein